MLFQFTYVVWYAHVCADAELFFVITLLIMCIFSDLHK